MNISFIPSSSIFIGFIESIDLINSYDILYSLFLRARARVEEVDFPDSKRLILHVLASSRSTKG